MKTNPETTKQLAKVKKLITANNPDSFALAVELVRSLEIDEDTWLALLAKSRIRLLFELFDSRVSNLLMELAAIGDRMTEHVVAAAPKNKAGQHSLVALTELSDAAASRLARMNNISRHWIGFELPDLELLDDSTGHIALARYLAKNPCGVDLPGLKSLSEPAAQVLAKAKLDLSIGGLTSASDGLLQILAEHRGGLGVSGLTSLSDAAAQALAKHKGGLYLHGLTSLSDVAAESLAKQTGEVQVAGLTSLSDSPGHVALAKKLAQNEGFLALPDLTSLSDAAAEALTKFEGHLQLFGEAEEAVDRARKRLAKGKK